MRRRFRLDELNQSDRSTFVEALGHLFEHSPWVAAETWERKPFGEIKDLQATLCVTMRSASEEKQLALIRAHPDLAGRLAQLGQLTAESAREQATAGLDKIAAEELAEFQALNSIYQKKFGFPFIICARLADKATILNALRERSGHSRELEFGTALSEIEKIASLRLADVLPTD